MISHKYHVRHSRRALYKRLARSILEQAFSDILQEGLPVKDRPKYFEDAKKFFDEGEYHLFCDCAEVDPRELEAWYDGLDFDKQGK